MNGKSWVGLSLVFAAWPLYAQDPSYISQATQDVGYGAPYEGAGSFGNNEPLFRYDDQERWKHGHLQNMPYYGGFYYFRPYNYHQVFAQAQTAAGWGMPATMPYSQQFWHRYENMVDLSRGDHSPVAPYVPPPKQFEHYPKPLGPGAQYSPPMQDRMRIPETPPQLTPPLQQVPEGNTSHALTPIQPTSNWTGARPQRAVPLIAP